MSSNRSSSSSDMGWHPAPMSTPQTPISKPEEIQIVLLGGPGSGKTRLQSRYILRQFVDIDSHGMGGHKHLSLADGTTVHLIIHELRTSRGLGNEDLSTEQDRYQEDCQRRRLLEQSDAVMLLFNPWSQASFEWINGQIIQDVLYTGRNKQPPSDIVRLLDSLTAPVPQPILPKRSANTTLPYDVLMKKLPRPPDEPQGDSDRELSFFPNKDKMANGRARNDYRSEFKRISIMVEGSALRNAEFMIHERDLPSQKLQSPTITPLTTDMREVDESVRRQQRVAVMMNKRQLPIVRHDSAISLQSVSTNLSSHSQTVKTGNGANYASDSSGNTHPVFRNGFTTSETVVDETNGRPNQRGLSAHAPIEETRLPVLVVATMSDRRKDTDGTLDRKISPLQGQKLAHKFGPNCAYIETSAKTNANVDEAYGIIVDQVMAKRAAARRDELTRARIEAAVAAVQATCPSARRAMPGLRSGRSCMPQWAWLDGFQARVPSWEAMSDQFSRAFATTGGYEQSKDEPTSGLFEDVWGDGVLKTPPQAHHSGGGVSGGHSQGHSQKSSGSMGLSQRMSQVVPFGIDNRTRLRDPASLQTVFEETGGRGAKDVIPLKTAQLASQEWVIVPDRMDMTYNPFEKVEFKRPMNMVTVTTLEPNISVDAKQPRYGADILERLKRVSLLKDLLAASIMFRNPQVSSVATQAPRIPPLTFDAVIIDDKSEAVSVLVRSTDQERNDETVERFLAQDATRDSRVVMLTPTAATNTLSAFVKEIASARVNRSVLHTTPPMPPPSLQMGPPIPRKNSPPPSLSSSSSSPFSTADQKLPTFALRPTPKALPPTPVAVVIAAAKAQDSLVKRAPIITTVEVRGSNSSEEEWQQQRTMGLQRPPNPRRARVRVEGNKRLGLAPPARTQMPAVMPASTWI